MTQPSGPDGGALSAQDAHRDDSEAGLFEADPVRYLLHAYNGTLSFAEPLLMEIWQSSGLTMSQLRILRWLRARGPLGAGVLNALSGQAGPSLARMLTRLEEAGFIRRLEDAEDRRRVLVEITDRGLAVGGRSVLRGTVFDDAARGMQATERARIADSLFSLRRHLDPVAGTETPARRRRPPGDPLDDDPVGTLLRAYNDTLVIAEPVLLEIWQSSDLTFTQLRILRWVRGRSPIGAGALTTLSGTPPASLARMLARLEDMGLVRRAFDLSDRRRVLIEITETGKAAIGRSVLSGSVFDAATRAMEPDLRRRIAEDLYLLRDHLRRAAARSSQPAVRRAR